MVVTYDTMRVMRHFLVNEDPQCGAEITRSLNILSGTLYPMLGRLRVEGWIAHVGSTIPDYLWKDKS